MLKIIIIVMLVSFGPMCVSHGGIFDRIVSGEIARAKTGKAQPIPIKQVIPIFPQELREEGVTGDVEVQFVINTEGTTSDIEVLKSSHKLFAESVSVAIEQWIFSPGTENGRAVDCKVKMTIPFKNKKIESGSGRD